MTSTDTSAQSAGRADLPQTNHSNHRAQARETIFKPTTYIGGHRHPDTDSIVSAIAYAALKNKTGDTSVAVRLGDINPETAMILKRYGVKAPSALNDIRTQVRDLVIDHPSPVSPDASLWEAWDTLQQDKTKSLPVADKDGRFLGLVTSGDIATFDMSQIREATTSTTFRNLLTAVNGEYISGPRFKNLKAPIYVTGRDCTLHKDGIVLGENIEEQVLFRAKEAGVLCLIVCSVEDPSEFRTSLSEKALAIDGMTVITSPFDLYRTLRLVTLATSVSNVMHDNIVRFTPDEYVDDVRNTMLSSRFRAYPVVDDAGRVAGMISRYHLIRHARKKVILVDHNEVAQSFPGIEQAEITEIIDHHRIGDVMTDGPIFVRNEPVGSTSTIIATMYFERWIPIDPPIAGILLAAILSDTIYFKSPTCTQRDRETAARLAVIADENIDKLAADMFTPDDSLLRMTAKELLNMDFKVFRMAGAHVAIAQISAMDISALLDREADLLAQMDIDRKLEDYDMVMMVLTDIQKGGSQILVSGRLGDAIERAYGEEARGKHSFYLPGVMSRKKQIVPQLSMVVGVG